jgi:hypothetical protein
MLRKQLAAIPYLVLWVGIQAYFIAPNAQILHHILFNPFKTERIYFI